MPGSTARRVTAKGVYAEHTGRKNGLRVRHHRRSRISGRQPEPTPSSSQPATTFTPTLVVAALRAGKHVFVEKPLCISSTTTRADCRQQSRTWSACPILTVGFNRASHRQPRRLKVFLRPGPAPLSLSYRFSPGPIPRDESGRRTRRSAEAHYRRSVPRHRYVRGNSRTLRRSASFAESVQGDDSDSKPRDDRVFITIRHANGSLSSISYQAGGDTLSRPERIEVFGGGRTAAPSTPRRRTSNSGAMDVNSGSPEKRIKDIIRICRFPSRHAAQAASGPSHGTIYRRHLGRADGGSEPFAKGDPSRSGA